MMIGKPYSTRRMAVLPCVFRIAENAMNSSTAVLKDRIYSLSTETPRAESSARKQKKNRPFYHKNDESRRKVKSSIPRASNPIYFKSRFRLDDRDENKNILTNSSKGSTKIPLKDRDDLFRKARTLGDRLEAGGEILPKSAWLKIVNIPPMSSLDAILKGIRDALELEQEKGIVDLDANWNPGLDSSASLPFLEFSKEDNSWLREARVLLSAFGRPTGWHIRFENRSIVRALLNHSSVSPIRCGSKEVSVSEFLQGNDQGSDNNDFSYDDELFKQQPFVSDATIRVENCPEDITITSLFQLFSRYDLSHDRSSIVRWHGQTSDGKVTAPRTIFLVHFADASWARAAMREKQATVIKGKILRLAQYPKQIIPTEKTTCG